MAAIIDLNSDMGESFGAYTLGQDEALLEWVSSANVACGFHAGDPRTMGQTAALAHEKGVGIGAHPGFPDLVGFGRRDMVMTPDEVSTDLLYQLGALDAFCRAAGAKLQHVKPHGALYNRIAVDTALARAVAETIALFDRELILVGLPDSAVARMADAVGIPFAREAFADRAYNRDGSLASRRVPGAVIAEPAQVARRAVRMALRGRVATLNGGEIELAADTICIHGDTPGAVDLARIVRGALEANGVAVKPLADVLQRRQQPDSGELLVTRERLQP
jgi:5-oxoprolinase (ATP-hydrolysing) subunit A